MKISYQAHLILILLCVCAALYFPGLPGPLLLDDFPQLEGIIHHSNQSLNYLLSEYLTSTSGPFGRPVSMLSFIFNASWFGDQLWYWKLTNLILHLFTVTALYWLVRLMLRNSRFSDSHQLWIGIFVSAAWALHPLHASTVLYTVQRMTILSTLFATLGMATYIQGRARMRSGKGGLGWLFIALTVCFPLAVLSKENALLMPVYFGLIEWIHFQDGRLHRLWQGCSLQKKCFASVGVVLATVAGLWFLLPHVIGSGFENREFTMIERLLTELRILVTYLSEILTPSWSNLGFYHDDISPSKDLLSPVSTLFSLMLITGLIMLGILLRKTNPLASFGILLFFSSHLLESTIFPLELMFEHRNYLGSFGIILALTAVIAPHITSTRIFALIGGVIVTALSLMLLHFSYTWGNGERLDTQLYAAHPNSPSAIANMADRYAEAWSPDLAWKILDRPERAGFKLQAMVIRCRLTHQLADSELVELNRRIDSIILSYELTGLIELANQGLDDQCSFSPVHFRNTLELAIAHSPGGLSRQKLLIYKAYYQRKSGELEQALSTLEEAYAAARTSPMPLFLAADWLLDANDNARGRQYYRRAIVAANPDKATTAEYIAHFETRFASQQ